METELTLTEGPIDARIFTDADPRTKDKCIRVSAVQKPGNGYNAGLKEGDLIVSLNGISTKGMRVEDFASVIKRLTNEKKSMVVYRETQSTVTIDHAIPFNDQNIEMNNASASTTDNPHSTQDNKKSDKTVDKTGINEKENLTEKNVVAQETNERKRQESTAEEIMSAKKQKSKESSSSARCDICTTTDNMHSTCLQTCFSCGVSVHETCYGLINAYDNLKYNTWKCHACASVGKTVTVKIPKKDTFEVQQIKITQRPTKCALCSITNGFHAMHPLFNKHGSEGRPITRKVGGVYQIVWVHTLCALVLATNQFSSGLVYGCNAEGDYEAATTNQTSSEEDEAMGDPHIDLDYVENDEKVLIASPHHFVITFSNDDGIDYLGRIQEFRKLTCYICKVKPKDQRRRIPTQCSHGDCRTAFHIGCARWGTDFNRVLFSPVETVETGNHIAEGYCRKHFKSTKNLIKGNIDESSEEEEMEDIEFVGDGSSDHSFELEQSNIDFVDDDDVVVEYDNSSPQPKMDNSKKKSSVTKSASTEPSKYMERKMNLQKAVREIEKAKKKKDKLRLLLFWKERLRPKDFDTLESHFEKVPPLSSSKTITTDNRFETPNANIASNTQDTPSIWDSMFIPNYVRGSINFDEWDEYQEISESDM